MTTVAEVPIRSRLDVGPDVEGARVSECVHAPVTTYFVEVISGSPIGPRACSFWVEIPISAPKPNSPPSVNRVLAFTMTAAESTAAVNRRAASREPVTIASVWPEECCRMWSTAASREGTTAAEMSRERYSAS